MLKTLLTVFTLLVLSATSVFASGFQLKTIGALDVTGTMSTEWWYTNSNPTLTGVTSVGSTVTVKIDATDYQASVDASGNWSYTPTTLTDGDHSVSLTSSAGSQTFTLHIGANLPATVTAPAQATTPVAGSEDLTLFLWLGAGLLLVTGILFFPSKQTVKV